MESAANSVVWMAVAVRVSVCVVSVAAGGRVEQMSSVVQVLVAMSKMMKIIAVVVERNVMFLRNVQVVAVRLGFLRKKSDLSRGCWGGWVIFA